MSHEAGTKTTLADYEAARTTSLHDWVSLARDIIANHAGLLDTVTRYLDASGDAARVLVARETMCLGLQEIVDTSEHNHFESWNAALVLVGLEPIRAMPLTKWLANPLRATVDRYHLGRGAAHDDTLASADSVILISRQELAHLDPQAVPAPDHSTPDASKIAIFSWQSLDPQLHLGPPLPPPPPPRLSSSEGPFDSEILYSVVQPFCARCVLRVLSTSESAGSFGESVGASGHDDDLLDPVLGACRDFCAQFDLFPPLHVLKTTCSVVNEPLEASWSLEGDTSPFPLPTESAVAKAVGELGAQHQEPLGSNFASSMSLRSPTLVLGVALGKLLRFAMAHTRSSSAKRALALSSASSAAPASRAEKRARTEEEEEEAANGEKVQDKLISSAISSQEEKNKTISLDGHIKFLELIETTLKMNDRRTRDWTALSRACLDYPECQTRHIKQKVKRVLQERRDRKQLRFWADIKETEGDIHQILPKVRQMVDDRHPAMDDFFVESLAEHLGSLASASKKSPGNLLEWNEPMRKLVTAKMVDLHVRYYPGRPFHHVQSHFTELFSLADVELGILSACECAECAEDWNLTTSIRSNEALLRLHWSREKAGLLRRVLELHRDFKTAMYSKFEGFEKKLRNWTRADVDYVLQLAHPVDECAVCFEGRRELFTARHGGGGSSGSSSSSSCSNNGNGAAG